MSVVTGPAAAGNPHTDFVPAGPGDLAVVLWLHDGDPMPPRLRVLPVMEVTAEGRVEKFEGSPSHGAPGDRWIVPQSTLRGVPASRVAAEVPGYLDCLEDARALIRAALDRLRR